MAESQLEYYGLSAFCIDTGQVRILIDPWVNEPDWTDRDIESFHEVDYILVTHGAHDHLGDTFEIAEQTGAEVVTEPAVAQHLLAKGLPNSQVTRMIWGNTIERDDVLVRALEAKHVSYFESEVGTLSGLPLGFHLEFGNKSVYYLGDTALFSDLELFGRLYQPDLALIPIAHAPGALSALPPYEAAVASEFLGVDKIVPVHYVPESGKVEEFREHLRERMDEAAPTVHALNPDDTLDL